MSRWRRQLNHRVIAGELLGRDWLDLAGPAGLAEGGHAIDADLLHRFTSRLQIVARVELFGRLGEDFADGACDGEPIVRVDVHLAHAVLDAALDFFYGHAPGLLQLT